MYQILLYGDISSYQVTNRDVITSKEVFEKLLKANGQDLEITINTLGGDVNEAFAIVNLINEYKAKHNAHVTTIANGECASSGVLLLLAGDTRKVKANTYPFIHNVWTSASGDANEFKAIADDLEQANNKIAEFYSQVTGIDPEYARELMGLNTSLSPSECELLGFATSDESHQEERLVLLNKLSNTKKEYINTMERNEKSLFQVLKNFFVNTKEIHTAEGDTLKFEDLEPTDNVEVGDEASIDGKPADGEVVTSEGDIITFEDGEVKEIEENELTELTEEVIEEENKETEEVIEEEPQPEVTEDIVDELAELRAELDAVKAELETIKAEKAELVNFKNKVTQIESQVVETQPKQLNKADKQIDPSAQYLANKKARAIKNK